MACLLHLVIINTFYFKKCFVQPALWLTWAKLCVSKPSKIGGTPEFGVLVSSVKKYRSWKVGLIFWLKLMFQLTKNNPKIITSLGCTYLGKNGKIQFHQVSYWGSLLRLPAPLDNVMYPYWKLLNVAFSRYI